MDNEKHTPGPWKVHRHSHVDGELWLTVLRGAWDITGNYAAQTGVVADAKFSAMSDEENEANARLIAAAPALLEALESLLIAAWGCGVPHPGERALLQEVVDNASAVIAAAKGIK